jgi:hypothetical protein
VEVGRNDPRSMRFREEVQEMLRRGDGELSVYSVFPHTASILFIILSAH